MSKLLITRPSPDCENTAKTLADKGYRCLVAPALSITLKQPVIAANSADILAVTSRQAARALASYPHLFDLTCYAVGDATRAQLKKSGYKNIVAANGTALDLAALMKKNLHKKKKILIACAPSTGRALADNLKKHFAHVARRSVYAVTDVKKLTPESAAAFAAGKISHVLFYSSRSTRAFLGQMRNQKRLKTVVALCLSAKIARSLDKNRWQAVLTAENPHEGALHRLLPAVKHKA